MDQTTDTADLTETEKYLNSVMDESGDESDGEEEASDALLGGIRTSLRTITRTAREALSTCKNKTELDSAADDIENSALKLMKMEKSFLKTATIVSSVIDDLIQDFEDDDDPEVILSREGNGKDGNPSTDDNDTSVVPSDKSGSGDAVASIEPEKKIEPYVFQVSSTNVNSVLKFREKLKKELHNRMEAYKEGLTNSSLRSEKKFRDLLAQVKLGRSDAETSPAYVDEMVYSFGDRSEYEGVENDEIDQGETEETSQNPEESLQAFLDSIPYTAEELMNHKYVPYDEEVDTDDSVLPSVDPITKELILNPVKNKFCNHVFDKESILSYIACTPEPKCPVYMCKNRAILEDNHFVSDPALTACIRRKNQL